MIPTEKAAALYISIEDKTPTSKSLSKKIKNIKSTIELNNNNIPTIA
jgi:hypothetical protein